MSCLLGENFKHQGLKINQEQGYQGWGFGKNDYWLVWYFATKHPKGQCWLHKIEHFRDNVSIKLSYMLYVWMASQWEPTLLAEDWIYI